MRQIRHGLEGAPGYSTVRKIVERLEEKGAVRRVRLEGKAWIYRPGVAREGMIRREIRRFLNLLFGGSAGPLVAHLAEMDALTIADLGEIEKRIGARRTPVGSDQTSRGKGRSSKGQGSSAVAGYNDPRGKSRKALRGVRARVSARSSERATSSHGEQEEKKP